MNKMTRALGAVTLLAASTLVHAQQVRVFSAGKPVPLSDELANENRGHPRDERKARRPLIERADAPAIAAAYTSAFLRCGLDEAKYPAAKPISPEETSYFVKDATYIPIPGTQKAVLLGEYSRGKAIVDLDKHKILTPQCPAGVRTIFWSVGGERVVFATQHVSKIDFHGASRALWTAKFGRDQDLYYIDSARADGGFKKVMSLPDEKVLDILVPDKADYLWVLSQSERMDLRDPKKWFKAASGAPAVKMDITLRKVDLQGQTLEQVEIARSVPSGTAHFVRE